MLDRVAAFLAAVDAADDEVLMLSRRHCHARHLSSVVVRRGEDGRLTRAFLAERGHEMGLNGGNGVRWPVGVHDHRYPLTLIGLYGVAHNIVYEISDPLVSRSLSVNEYQFRSCLDSDGGGIELVGGAFVKQVSDATISPFDGRVRLQADELHTVWCREGWSAAWLVEEGPTTRSTTRLFTRGVVDLAGLYQPFGSPDEVRSYAKSFFQ